MYSFNQIGNIASGILEYEFDFITSPTEKQSELLSISGSLVGKIGELNILLNQKFCFTGVDGNPFPRLGQEEISVLEEMYLRDYNTKQARKILRGSYDITVSGFDGGNGVLWTELKEGDTTIKRPASAIPGSFSNRIDLSKNFKALAEESESKIKELSYAYNMYGAQPRQVAGNDAPDIDLLLCGPQEVSTGIYLIGSEIEPSGIEPSGIEPSGIEPSGIEPSGIEPSGIEPSGIEPSGIEPSGIEPSGGRPSGTGNYFFTDIDSINDYRVAFNVNFTEENGDGEIIYPNPPFIPGEEIKIKPNPNPGYEFQYWSSLEPEDLFISEEGIFTMPEEDVIISGYYT